MTFIFSSSAAAQSGISTTLRHIYTCETGAHTPAFLPEPPLSWNLDFIGSGSGVWFCTSAGWTHCFIANQRSFQQLRFGSAANWEMMLVSAYLLPAVLCFSLQIYWFKDGKQISKRSDHYRIQREPDGTCSLHAAASTLDDDGNYTIMAANPQVNEGLAPEQTCFSTWIFRTLRMRDLIKWWSHHQVCKLDFCFHLASVGWDLSISQRLATQQPFFSLRFEVSEGTGVVVWWLFHHLFQQIASRYLNQIWTPYV